MKPPIQLAYRPHRLALLAGLLALAPSGCLPADTRPAPGQVVLTISGDSAFTSGVATADGWQIDYDRFVLSIGEVGLQGDACNPYAEIDYLRIVDLRQPGPHLLSTMHALGRCEPTFRLQSPTASALLGAGVDEATRDFMRTPAGDAFVERAGVALLVAGRARRDGPPAAEVRFRWAFRRDLEYSGCEPLDFRGEEAGAVDISVRAAALFQLAAGDPAGPTFGPIAAADRDGDGEVTLAELGGTPHAGEDGSPGTLAEHLYLVLVPRLPRFADTDRCTAAPLNLVQFRVGPHPGAVSCSGHGARM
jgi:hypothetical protein